VRSAKDGFSAFCEFWQGIPDVLLSYFNMPGMSGFKLLSVIPRRFYVFGRACAGEPGLAVSPRQTKIFPNLFSELAEVGESAGALPRMLDPVAEFFEEDAQAALIVMGGVVVVILIDLYLPIFSLSQASTLHR